MTEVCRRYLVSGEVQGVFFRASTARQAERLNLTGWAKNLADGRVEVVACGAANGVEELARWLESGPPRASVARVHAESIDTAECGTLTDFRTG